MQRGYNVDDDKTDNQRDRTDNFKVKQRDRAGTAHRSCFPCLRCRHDSTEMTGAMVILMKR